MSRRLNGLIEEVLERTEGVLGPAEGRARPIPLHEPTLGQQERDAVLDCLDQGWVSSAGPFVGAFEEEICKTTGAGYAVAVVSGTAALHVALSLAGVQADDEVLLPALTFVATANAVAYLRAVPHFVDVDPRTLGVDPERLALYLEEIAELRDGVAVNRRTGRRLKALVPVHVFGHLADMQGLGRVAARYGLEIVEDATESLGSRYRDGRPGFSARLAVLSFNGNKIVTTGGGGAILTDDACLAAEARHLTTTAKRPHAWAYDHDRIGFNYRLPNLNAALGIAQMRRLEGFVEAKRRLAAAYAAAFAGCAEASVFAEPPHSHSNYWLNALLLEVDSLGERDEILHRLHDRAILARPLWTPMHFLEIYADAPRDRLPVTERLHVRLINLPSSPGLAPDADPAS